jgi:hypothetical protein
MTNPEIASGMIDRNTHWYRMSATLFLGLLLFACQGDPGIDLAAFDRERILSAADKYLHEEPLLWID